MLITIDYLIKSYLEYPNYVDLFIKMSRNYHGLTINFLVPKLSRIKHRRPFLLQLLAL